MSDVIINNHKEFNAKNGKKLISNENITVDHFKAAVLLRACIQKCPMDKWCKEVMLRRVGKPWEGLMSKTHLQIALELRCTEKEVIEIEKAGKNIVGDFMRRCGDMALSKKFENDVANKAIQQENTNKVIEN